MKKIIPVTAFLFLLIVSCKKEKFPENDDLQGSWLEQTDMVFKQKLLFEKEILFFTKPTSTDTFFYRLDKEQRLIYLSLKNNPSIGETNHEIFLNKKKETLTIRGLLGGDPGYISESVFKKE
jgi:hypothetical protein